MQAPRHTSLYNNIPNGSADHFSGPNAISLYYGEKRESFNDLEIQTINGVLGINRSYRQFYQDTLRIMGAGWSHSHHSYVHNHSGGYIYIVMPDGGQIVLRETSPNGAHYRSLGGLNAELFWNNGTSDPTKYFELILADGTRYWFSNNLKLSRIVFPNSKAWIYTYQTNSSSFDFGLLRTVADEFGNELRFRYYNIAGITGEAFKHKQLWRIGDHKTTNLTETTIAGRYIQYDYIKATGANIALLQTVRDVIGQTWTYEYHDRLEWHGTSLIPLRRVISPIVVAPSTGFASASIRLKNINYTWRNSNANDGVLKVIQSLGQEGGTSGTYKIVETYDFFTNDPVNPRTEVTVAGKTTTYKFNGEVYGSEQDAEGAVSTQTLNTNYQITQLTNGNGDSTAFSWTTSSLFLQQTTDEDGYITRFTYENDNALNGRLIETEDAIGRISKYWYDTSNSMRNPNRVRVFNGTTIIKETHFIYNDQGSKTIEIEFDPQFSPVGWKSNVGDTTCRKL